MPTSPLPSRVLDVARRFYLRFGHTPVDLFALLVSHGYSVTRLEEAWERGE